MHQSFAHSAVPGVSSGGWAAHKPTSYKAIVIGPSGVGKTSICKRMTELNSGGCDDITATEATIGVDFSILTYRHESRKYTLQLWDTAGQERFAPIVKSYYRGCTLVFVVLDSPCLLASVRKTHCGIANVCLPVTHWDARYAALDAGAIVQAEVDKYLMSFKALAATSNTAAFVVLNKSDAVAVSDADADAMQQLLDMCATASKAHTDFAAFRCFSASALKGDGVCRLYEATKRVAAELITTRESAAAAEAASSAKAVELTKTPPQQPCSC